MTPHLEYRRLGATDTDRQSAYRQLFKTRLPEKTLTEIRVATNKAWALGSDRFKRRIEKQLERRASPQSRGGEIPSTGENQSSLTLGSPHIFPRLTPPAQAHRAIARRPQMAIPSIVHRGVARTPTQAKPPSVELAGWRVPVVR